MSILFCNFVGMRTFLLLSLALCTLFCHAAEPWKLTLENKSEQMTLRMNLYEESIDIPGMEFLGPMNGYLSGKGIYGIWMVTSFSIESDRRATLRLSNDQGSETQSVRLTQQSDSTYLMELRDGVVVKRADNRKLVKVPNAIVFRVRQ